MLVKLKGSRKASFFLFMYAEILIFHLFDKNTIFAKFCSILWL